MFPLLIVVTTFIYKCLLYHYEFGFSIKSGLLKVLLSDGNYIAIIVILLVDYKVRSQSITVVKSLLACLLYVIYLCDFILTRLLNTRLYISDLVKFYGEFIKLGEIAQVDILLSAIFTLSLFIIFVRSESIIISRMQFSSLPVVFLVTISSYFYPRNSVVESFFQNVLVVNLDNSYMVNYSDEFHKIFSFKPNISCNNIEAIKPSNIYVFVLESWSKYQSKHYGGLNDWTPRLDKLASENITLKNFHANSYSTEGGLYSLLTGKPLIEMPGFIGTNGSINVNNMPVDNSILETLSSFGYENHFITSGNLNFLNKKKWLKKLGFDKIIGSDNFEENQKKYLFNSVNDQKLFEKAKNIFDSNTNYKFVIVENVGTHPPFYSPGKKGIVKSEESSFRYTDMHLGELIDSIDRKNNLIIVVSDHRALTPITENELDLYGDMAASQIPAFIIWDGIRSTIETDSQQSDLIKSISNAIQGKSCNGDIEGSIYPFDNTTEAQCIVFRRGDYRSWITTRCNGKNSNAILDGDNTRLVNGKQIKRDVSIDIINYLRLTHEN